MSAFFYFKGVETASFENFVKYFRRPLSENTRGILVRVDYPYKSVPDPDPNDGNDELHESGSTVQPQRIPDVGQQFGHFSKNPPKHKDVVCPNNSARRLISGDTAVLPPSAPNSHSYQVASRNNLNDGKNRGNTVGDVVDANDDSVDQDFKNSEYSFVGSYGQSELLESVRNKKKPGRKVSSGKVFNNFRQIKYFIVFFSEDLTYFIFTKFFCICIFWIISFSRN